MQKLHEYIQAEAVRDCNIYYDSHNDLYVVFLPKLDHAYIESEGRTFWYEASGVNHAIEQHMALIKSDIVVGY